MRTSQPAWGLSASRPRADNGVMKKFTSKLQAYLEEGRSFVVATIVTAEGSTPRKVGSKMIVHPDMGKEK